MRLTIARWIASTLACCAFVAALLLPLPRKARTTWTWFGQYPAELASSSEALSSAARDLNDALREYRVVQGVARWKAHHASDAVQIDAATPAPVADFVRTVAQNEWRRAGEGASASHAAVFVYFDTSSVPGSAAPNQRRLVEPRRPADVWYALPEITDGERCVVLVRVRTAAPTQLAHLRERSLLGPCAFFAAFGKPGRAVHQWLEATSYRAASLPDWDKPHAPSVDAGAVYALQPETSRCLTGQASACAAAVRVGAASGTVTRIVSGNSAGEGSSGKALLLGDASPRFLADAVREFGRPRFARFWTSDAPLDSAFAAASNVSLTEWTTRWLVRSYGSPRPVSVIRLQDLLWAALLIPVLIVIAARKRERVLVERVRLIPGTAT
jgi:hypothetical protein